MRCCVWLMGWAILAPAIVYGQIAETENHNNAKTAESIALAPTLVAPSEDTKVISGKQRHKQSQTKSPQHRNAQHNGKAEYLGSLFDAMNSSQVEVKVVAVGAHQANVILTNRTDAPVTVQLPDHFAAVHVLGQFGGPGGLFGGGGQLGGGQFGGPGGQFGGGQPGGGLGNGQGGGNQAIGGGFNQGGGGSGFGNLGLNGGGNGGLNGPGFGGGGQPGGLFRLEPDKPRKLEATMVCLEYGKPDPNPRLPYKLVPLETVTTDKAIAEICRNLSQGMVSQRVAQAIAWHVANGLDWEKLSKLNRSESHFTGAEKFFTPEEIEQARQLVRRWKTGAGEGRSLVGAPSRYTNTR